MKEETGIVFEEISFRDFVAFSEYLKFRCTHTIGDMFDGVKGLSAQERAIIDLHHNTQVHNLLNAVLCAENGIDESTEMGVEDSLLSEWDTLCEIEPDDRLNVLPTLLGLYRLCDLRSLPEIIA